MALTGEYIPSDLGFGFLEPGSATNYYELSTYVTNFTLGQARDKVDTTCYGTSVRTFIQGLSENEASFTLLHNNTPAYAQRPQTRLQQLFANQTSTTWRVRPLGTGSTLPEITFTATVQTKNETFANGEAVSSEVTLAISGAITDSTQS